MTQLIRNGVLHVAFSSYFITVIAAIKKSFPKPLHFFAILTEGLEGIKCVSFITQL